ncbi:signal peptidase I [Tersicoccus sp. Bi-70]|uniref:signal peptidase I n=1 Tax=Tersicoccus sp. Bi-70 TaxID=1897634 RepID=UPI0013012535|nr:signal peptidase I [Tersicoccus sp. Bi-70]
MSGGPAGRLRFSRRAGSGGVSVASASAFAPVRGVLVALAALVVAAALLGLVVVPRMLGWVPLTVLSGSMSPTIPTGSQVVVRPVRSIPDMARLAVGDVVTFAPRDDAALVTHRIVAVGMDATGAPSLTTRGDANGSADADPVGPAQLRGVVEYHVPGAGWVATALDPGQKQTGVHLGAAALGGYAAWHLFRVWRPRRPRAATAAPVTS